MELHQLMEGSVLFFGREGKNAKKSVLGFSFKLFLKETRGWWGKDNFLTKDSPVFGCFSDTINAASTHSRKSSILYFLIRLEIPSSISFFMLKETDPK